jgi:K+-transporting ATPase ATPase C chain
MMRRQLFPAVIAIVLFTAVTLLYGVGTTLADQALFKHKADGSLVEDASGRVVGSSLIGQDFTAENYFHPRPAADGYASGPDYSYGSNYGPTNETFLDGVDDPETPKVDESKTTGVDDLVRAYRKENGLGPEMPVPVDAVTASGSGLDPAVSVANAKIQAPRVAASRHLALATVLALVKAHTDDRALGILGEPAVNVLELNLALDRRRP